MTGGRDRRERQKETALAQRRYQSWLDLTLEELAERGGEAPRLLLHSCCAPCSSAVLEYLHRYFALTVFYYNPNLTEAAEYEKRAAEQQRLIAALNRRYAAEGVCPIRVQEGAYEPERFLAFARERADCPEGGERCSLCYALRLEETARQAAAGGFAWFATTLTVSPRKDAERLNRIGSRLAQRYPVRWLFSDFKKKGGFQRSVELSREYGLYRQNYCGCLYSRARTGQEAP